MEEFNKDYGTFISDFEKAEVYFLNSLLLLISLLTFLVVEAV